MKELIGKKITDITHDKKQFIIHTNKGDVDLMKLYDVEGRSIYLIEQMKKLLEHGSLIDGVIDSVRKYEGNLAMGRKDKIIKQKRLTLSISLRFKEDAKIPEENFCITFCK